MKIQMKFRYFIQEITDKVLNTEDFCLEYAYYVSEDRKSVTLMKNI